MPLPWDRSAVVCQKQRHCCNSVASIYSIYLCHGLSSPRLSAYYIRTGASPTGSPPTGRDYSSTGIKYASYVRHTYTYTTPMAVRDNRRNSYYVYPSPFSTQRRWYPATPKTIFTGSFRIFRGSCLKLPRIKFRGNSSGVGPHKKLVTSKTSRGTSRPTSSSVQPQIASRETPSKYESIGNGKTLGRGECIFRVAGGGSIVDRRRRRPVQLCLYCGRCACHMLYG